MPLAYKVRISISRWHIPEGQNPFKLFTTPEHCPKKRLQILSVINQTRADLSLVCPVAVLHIHASRQTAKIIAFNQLSQLAQFLLLFENAHLDIVVSDFDSHRIILYV